MTRITCHLIAIALTLGLAPVAALALTPGQAYWKAAEFLRSEGAMGWEALEAQPVLLGEAVAGDPLAAGPRSTTLLASLALGSVDARARRARTLGALKLNATLDSTALLAIAGQSSEAGFGVDVKHLSTPLDTALAIQALDATNQGTHSRTTAAVQDLVDRQLPSGLWPLLRAPDATGAGGEGDVATTAQAVLALAPRQADHPTAFANAVTALTNAAPTRAADWALRLLALLEANPTAQQGALDELVAMQLPDGSFGEDALAEDRVYATALAARAIWRAGGQQPAPPFPFDADPDIDGDGIPNELDAFPFDPLEWADLDRDGIGDNEADSDLDGDGIPNELDAFPEDASEWVDTDGNGIGDNADPDDDGDGIPDLDELLAGLDPKDADTDGDSFRDGHELLADTDALNPLDHPLPDGDIFPLGAPDGVVDLRDELLAHRILRGLETVPSGSAWQLFLRHADVAPLEAGAPAPNGPPFDAADALVITRRARGLLAGW